MQLGKNVYCQKPLTHDLYEARKLTEFARLEGPRYADGHPDPLVELLPHGRCCLCKLARLAGSRKSTPGSAVAGVTRLRGLTSPIPCRPASTGTSGSGSVPSGPSSARSITIRSTGASASTSAPARSATWLATSSIRCSGALGLTAPDLGPFRRLRLRTSGTGRWTAEVHYVFPGTGFHRGQDAPGHLVRRLAEGRRPKSAPCSRETTCRAPAPFLSARRACWCCRMLPGLCSIRTRSSRTSSSPKSRRKIIGAGLWKLALAAGPRPPASTTLGHWPKRSCVGTVALRFPKTTLNWNAAALSFTEGEANQYIRRKYRNGWAVKGLS